MFFLIKFLKSCKVLYNDIVFIKICTKEFYLLEKEENDVS